MKEKNKAYKASKAEIAKKVNVETSNASIVVITENATVVDDAINNGIKQVDQITAGVVTPSKNLKQKYQSAFDNEGFIVSK